MALAKESIPVDVNALAVQKPLLLVPVLPTDHSVPAAYKPSALPIRLVYESTVAAVRPAILVAPLQLLESNEVTLALKFITLLRLQS